MALDAVGLQPQYADLRANTRALPNRQPTIGCLEPADIYQKVVELGVQKANTSWWRTFLLAVLGGIYLSFGGALMYFAAGQAPGLQASNPGLQNLLKGLFGLPFGLALIMICGGELVTASFAYLPAALFEGRISVFGLSKNWFWSFWGNLCGSLLVVWLIDESHLLAHDGKGPINDLTPVATAITKTHKEWGYAVVAGMLANWMVCLGVWQATAAQDIVSKIFAVWIPVAAFVTIGLEHVVANMFLIPFGMKVGANVTVGRYIWHSVIPVAIGNCIGPAFFLSGFYSLTYGTLGLRLGNLFYKATNKGQLPAAANYGYDDSAHGAAPDPLAQASKANGNGVV